MATYYVSPSGSNANNGLGPDASHASNKPWLTIGKALGAAGIASGDTVYIGPGTYREVVTVAMTSAVAETSVLGDPGNAQGFKNGSGVLLNPAEVVWTAYTTSDTTAPNASSTLDLSGRDYLTFKYLSFVGGSGNPAIVESLTETSTNINFTECLFNQGYNFSARLIRIVCAAGVSLNWTISRCIKFSGSSSFVDITLKTSASADYDANITLLNVVSVGPTNFVQVTGSGADAFYGGGVHVINCTVIACASILRTNSALLSTSIPCTVSNSICISGSTATCIVANTSGQITETYNLLVGTATHTNVTPGTGTVSDGSYSALFQLGQENIVGSVPKPYLMPTKSSPVLGFGGSSPPSVDMLNKPRPGGGQSSLVAVGAYERDNTFGQETITVRSGSNAISITGPGTQDFHLPVDAVSTTVTVYVRWDGTYTGTKPQMKVLNGGECGVADASTTATGSSGAWEQLSLNFTPARTGIVTVRLQSNDTNGAGKMYADSFGVA